MSKPTEKLSKYFATRPSRYGLRGDPPLWEAFYEIFDQYEIPESGEALDQILHSTFELLVGKPVEKGKDYYVEKFDQGGMSRGFVNSDFWLNVAFPKITEAYLEDRRRDEL